MHWCTGKVNLAGQNFTVIWFDATNPISWPEAGAQGAARRRERLRDQAIGVSNVSVSSEKERLQMKYGWKPTEVVFPGRNPRIERLMPAERYCRRSAIRPARRTGAAATAAAADRRPSCQNCQKWRRRRDETIPRSIGDPPSGQLNSPGRHTPPRKVPDADRRP
jgi:hypothetical protein